MGSSQTEKTTTSGTGSQEPWAPSQVYLKGVLGDAQGLYSGGVGSKIYRGSTVIPDSVRTTEAKNDILGVASGAGSDMGKPLRNYSSMMDVLNPISRGDFANDSTFNSTLGAAQRDTANAVNMNMGANGRFGSGTHAKTLATAVNDTTNQAMLDRQAWASGENRQYGAAMPSAFTSAIMPARAKMEMGAMDEDLASRLKQDELRIFDAEQNMPWEALARANAIFSGAGSMGNVTSTRGSTVSPSYRPSMGQQALGFGTTLAGSAMGKGG